jgi:hypothetical protein
VLLVFATSDKGGTGRSVTSSNVLYRSALTGMDVCYLDFDFGSPTSGAIFDIESVARGTPDGDGLHTYLQYETRPPRRIDVWEQSERDIKGGHSNFGRLVLLPGDQGGGEWTPDENAVRRCAALFRKLSEEFDVCLVDLSAGRSGAVDMVLDATARREVKNAQIKVRWLIFHRWTRQHILAAYGLVQGEHGILRTGETRGHPQEALEATIRYIRTAVVEIDSTQTRGMRAAQMAWLRQCDTTLSELAGRLKLGQTRVLGTTPLDPMLQWREQLLTDNDVWATQVANTETIKAFGGIAERIMDDRAWEGL